MYSSQIVVIIPPPYPQERRDVLIICSSCRVHSDHDQVHINPLLRSPERSLLCLHLRILLHVDVLVGLQNAYLILWKLDAAERDVSSKDVVVLWRKHT